MGVQDLLQTLALSAGVAWASGINVYAVLGTLGLAGSFGYVNLPSTLEVVQGPVFIGASLLMFVVQFFMDKIPSVDIFWDALHTFIRIPAGAVLAASAVGEVDPALMVATGIIGGTITVATHATKAGSRALINTSPEPFSNWAASFTEDAMVLGGLWAIFQYPVVFLGLFLLFILIACLLLPKLIRGIRAVLRRIGAWFGVTSAQQTGPA
ncbi:MAG: DUF4126 domain-containing protein [Gammaproteobacteria bacterium]|nr:DUF4126 domain-containing protein [Gammaproteobacteria bacterium]